MAEYPDLTDYTYLPPDQRDTDACLVNVGWLGDEHPFPTAKPCTELVDALILLAGDMRHRTRGFHECPFCLVLAPIRVKTKEMERTVPLGMGEIHVEAADGTVYAAPTLIIHYVTDHHYNPPEAFRQAVLGQPESDGTKQRTV